MRTFDHPNYEHGFVCPICKTNADEPVTLVPYEEPDEDGLMRCHQVHADCWQVVSQKKNKKEA